MEKIKNKIQDYFKLRLDTEKGYQVMVYGKCVTKRFTRKSWNPMRYLLGDIKEVVIDPAELAGPGY